VSAVRLEEHPGSRLKSPTKTLVNIPAHAIVVVDGLVAASGLVNVIWEGNHFSVFNDDLKAVEIPGGAAG
jgi:hypothetical protein